MQAYNRHFSAYELTHLQRHGVSVSDAQALGQMPVEYMTGHVDFAGLDLLVTPDVLIPRVETEELVQLVATYLADHSALQSPIIAELGTGSGAISLALAQKLLVKHQNFEIVAGDISPLALKVAVQNRDRLLINLPKTQSITFIKSDLWHSFPTKQFDVVIANLPYIPHGRMANLDQSVIGFEPKIALDGGYDGLTLIRHLVQTSSPFLKTGTTIFLEIDETHTLAQLSEISADFEVKLITDQFGKSRFAILRLLNT